ncbi:MAG: hypothetical protein HC789_08670 [Microcoleus sp. CSU_2_2]|nr:hypothetical protein [Microcoleus sp. CSU_2_2]
MTDRPSKKGRSPFLFFQIGSIALLILSHRSDRQSPSRSIALLILSDRSDRPHQNKGRDPFFIARSSLSNALDDDSGDWAKYDL